MREVVHVDRVDGREGETLLVVAEPATAFERGEEVVDQDRVAWRVAAVERRRRAPSGECALFVRTMRERYG